ADAVFEEVAQARRPSLQQSNRVRRFDVLREQKHGHSGVLLADLHGRLQALDAVGRRHPDVGDHQIGALGGHARKQLLLVTAAGADVEAGSFEKVSQPFPKEHRVVGDNYSHGSSTEITAPLPGGLVIARVPPTAATLSCSPTRPEPPAGLAPPT